MILRRLRLQEYRQYAALDVTFPASGLIGIVGRNGSGKSTLLEAHRFVLFGPDACRTTKDGIRRGGAEGPCWVEATYESPEQGRIIARRELDGDATVTVNGKLVAKSARGATQYLAGVLGMDLRAWLLSYEVAQKDLEGFTRCRPAERRDQLLRWLGIERLDKVLATVGQDSRTAKATWEGLVAGLEPLEALEASLAAEEHRRNLLEGQGAEIQAQLTVLRADAAQAKAEMERLVALESQARALELEWRALVAQVEQVQARLRTIDAERTRLQPLGAQREALAVQAAQLPAAKAKLAELEATARAVEMASGEFARAQRALATVTAELAALPPEGAPVDLAGAEAQVARCQRAVREAATRRAEVVAQGQRADQDLEAARRRYARVKELGAQGACPQCGQVLGDQYAGYLEKIVAEGQALRAGAEALRSQQMALTQELEALQAQEAAAERALTAARQAEAHAQVRRAKAETLTRAQKAAQEAVDAAQRALDELPAVTLEAARGAVALQRQAVDRLTQAAAELQRVEGLLDTLPRLDAEAQELAARLVAADQAAADLDARRHGLGFQPAALAAARTRYEQAQGDLQAAEVALARHQAEHAAVVVSLTQLQARAATVRTKQAEAETHRTRAHRLAVLSEALGRFRGALVARIQPTLSRLSSELFTRLVDGRYGALTLTAEYDLLVDDQGVAYPLSRFSGGEVDLAALALRLAVARMIAEAAGSPARFLLLDEPFTSLDAHYLDEALAALRQLQPVFQQIVVVSHLDALKAAATTVFEVVEDADGVSHVGGEHGP